MIEYRFLAAVIVATTLAMPAYAQGEETGTSSSPPVVVINPGSGVEIRNGATSPLEKTNEAAAEAEPNTNEDAAEEAAMAEAAEVSKAEEEKEQKAPPAPVLKPTLNIDIDLRKQRMTVLENGRTVHTWPISSGRYRYRTPTGTFKPVWMTREWYSRQYDYAPMPYSIFFHEGVAIHATQATSMLGRPASHGCVRLSHKNASTLYGIVSRHGKAMTKIVVHGTPDFDTEIAERGERTPSAHRRAVSQKRRYAAPYGYYSYYDYGYGPPPGYGRQRRAYAYGADRPRYAAPRSYRPRGLFGGDGY